MSETEISKLIKNFLDASRIYNLRLNAGKVKKGGTFIHLVPKGTPDRFFLYKGKSVFCEVKAKGQKPTAEQTETHETIRRGGGFVIVADSFESFLLQFKEIK